MTVGELRKLLEGVPDDLHVLLAEGDGFWAWIESATKEKLPEPIRLVPNEKIAPKGTEILLIR